MKIAVAGATGYSGQELLKLLAGHSHFEISELISREQNIDDLNRRVDDCGGLDWILLAEVSVFILLQGGQSPASPLLSFSPLPM